MTVALEASAAEARAERERRRNGEQLAEEADRLAGNLRDFTKACWHLVVPQPMVATWHIDAICDHVQAAYERDITRLLITVPPGHLKSSIVSVIAPVWRWTHKPSERFAGASWGEHLSQRDTRKSRLVIRSPWHEARWGHLYELARDENMKGRYSNDQGGHRIATYVGGGTGDRGDILQIDDPHNAKEAQTETQLEGAIEWWGDTWLSRMNDSIDSPGVMIVIGQRIHENDLIEHIIQSGEGWTHLCLPARTELEGHPYAPYPKSVHLPSGRVMQGDPRTEEGELIAPNYTSEARLRELEKGMTPHIAAAQLQQRPAAREGDLLKTAWWRYYEPQAYDETDESLVARLPKFRRLVSSWDTPLKEREKNDLIAGQLWGEHQADRYLLMEVHGHMNMAAAGRAVLAMNEYATLHWPDAIHKTLIEKGGYGLDLANDLKRKIIGVTSIPEPGDKLPDKYTRAESAASCLESGNVFLPGHPRPGGLGGPDSARSPASTVYLVATCATFPNGRYKDPVDSWSQAMNYLDRHRQTGGSISSPRGKSVAELPTGIPER